MNVIKFDQELYNFHDVVEKFFDVLMLNELHNVGAIRYKDLFEVGKDSSTIYHNKFYDKLHEGWPVMEKLYYDFIHNIISPMFDENFLYQKFPTFRVHLPGNIAVGRFHKDSEFGHPEGEVNFIIPLTDSNDTASVWCETEENNGDYHPMALRVGHLIQFNGNRLTHGNKVNEEGKTRVSMDFRILPMSKCTGEGESVTLKTKFKEGEYYKGYYKNTGVGRN